MNVYLVINKILQLFMMIVLGFILGKMKDFDESFIDKMNRFCFKYNNALFNYFICKVPIKMVFLIKIYFYQ